MTNMYLQKLFTCMNSERLLSNNYKIHFVFINTLILQCLSTGTVDKEVTNCIMFVEVNTFGVKMLQCLIVFYFKFFCLARCWHVYIPAKLLLKGRLT